MRCFLFLLVFAFPITAIAANAFDDHSRNAASNCGATTADALKQARVSLANRDAASERTALECLVEAVSRLEAEQPVTYRGLDNHLTIAVPRIGHVDLPSNTSVPSVAAKGKE
jgi:hypothetical protein